MTFCLEEDNTITKRDIRVGVHIMRDVINVRTTMVKMA